ncbi:MAG: hypothetical protein EOO28_11630 [Comamonadaceae bacterium]|nr:MAG: hypothetical protein EOO28_11630 [Comamonadaceae bacterium]
MVVLVLSMAVLSLAGCDRPAPAVREAAAAVPPGSAAPPPAAAPVRPVEISAAFRRDIEACPAAMRVLARDKAFVDAFGYANNRESKPWDWFVAKSAARGNRDVRYLLANRKYFDINISMHGHPLALGWIKAAGIYCAPTLRRLIESEAGGESEPGWAVRSWFLDMLFKGLQHPADAVGTGAIADDYFKRVASEAAQIYAGQRRADFRAWVGRAIHATEAERSKIDAAQPGAVTAEEQHRVFDERVKFLKSLAH